MLTLDPAALADPLRLAAVARARLVLPTLPIPLTKMSRHAARLLDAPMGLITLVGQDFEYFAGSYGAPRSLVAGDEASVAYSLCKYVVSADGPVLSADLDAEDDARLRHHPLAVEYGVRAFLGAPLRDTDDRPVGSVTVLDTRPRPWTGSQIAAVVEIAELVGPVPATAPHLDTPLAGVEAAVVFDAVAEAFLTLNPDAVITGWNSAAEELFGWTSEQACGRHVEDLLRPGDGPPAIHTILDRLLQVHATEVDADRHLHGAVRVRHRDGRPIHAQVRLSVIHSPAGAIICAFFTDITGQVTMATEAASAAEAAEMQRAFADALLDSLSEGVAAVDAEGRAVVFNRALRRLCGQPETASTAEAMAGVLPVLHHPDGEPFTARDLVLTAALSGATLRDTQVLVRLPGLPDRHVLTSGQPIQATDGRVIGAVATIRDVTVRRRTEQFRDCELAVARLLNHATSLEEAASELARIVAATLGWPYVSIRRIDPATGVLRRIGHWDEGSDAIRELLTAQLTPTTEAVMRQVWATGEPVWIPDLETSPLFDDPEARERTKLYVHHGLRSAVSVPFHDGTDTVGALTCFADTAETDQMLITGLVTAIGAQVSQFLIGRRAADLALQLAHTRAEFTALVGHDMRTPLTTIATYTQLLLDDPAPRPDSDQQLLRGIDRGTARLRSLVDALLDLAALEAGDQPLQAHDVDLSALLRQAVADVRPTTEAAGITLHAQIDPDVHLDGDDQRLHALADTLLASASSATSGGDLFVALHARNGAAELTLSAPGDAATELVSRFSPANATGTGLGSSADTVPRLGLALVRVITERHGGTFALTGPSTIRLRIPLAAAETP
ncbi:PAS domain-containing protein [Cryptosporangium minutisporangium]|uniref:histidine kinase n=1 Tax=Cryptosporangium minutisporangium TaxID=113569 RepID=A0ABP6T0A9_9ACTN